MKGWLAILVVLVGTLEFSNGKLTVETTETGFVVSINSSVKVNRRKLYGFWVNDSGLLKVIFVFP